MNEVTRVIKSREERENEIIEAALILFQDKGYDQTSIQDIADYLGISTGLCYRYFKSKQEIFLAASNRYAEQFIEKIEEPLSKDGTVCDQFNLAIKRIILFALNHQEFETTFHNEIEISTARLDGVMEHFVQTMIPIVKEGIDQGVFHCSNPELTVRFISYGFSNVIHHNMPSENIKQHITSKLSDLAKICKNILQVEEGCNIGEGWIED